MHHTSVTGKRFRAYRPRSRVAYARLALFLVCLAAFVLFRPDVRLFRQPPIVIHGGVPIQDDVSLHDGKIHHLGSPVGVMEDLDSESDPNDHSHATFVHELTHASLRERRSKHSFFHNQHVVMHDSEQPSDFEDQTVRDEEDAQSPNSASNHDGDDDDDQQSSSHSDSGLGGADVSSHHAVEGDEEQHDTEHHDADTGNAALDDNNIGDDENGDDTEADDADADAATTDDTKADDDDAVGTNTGGSKADDTNPDGTNADDTSNDDARNDDVIARDGTTGDSNGNDTNANDANADDTNADDAVAEHGRDDVMHAGKASADDRSPEQYKSGDLQDDEKTGDSRGDDIQRSGQEGDAPIVDVAVNDDKTRPGQSGDGASIVDVEVNDDKPRPDQGADGAPTVDVEVNNDKSRPGQNENEAPASILRTGDSPVDLRRSRNSDRDPLPGFGGGESSQTDLGRADGYPRIVLPGFQHKSEQRKIVVRRKGTSQSGPEDKGNTETGNGQGGEVNAGDRERDDDQNGLGGKHDIGAGNEPDIGPKIGMVQDENRMGNGIQIARSGDDTQGSDREGVQENSSLSPLQASIDLRQSDTAPPKPQEVLVGARHAQELVRVSNVVPQTLQDQRNFAPQPAQGALPLLTQSHRNQRNEDTEADPVHDVIAESVQKQDLNDGQIQPVQRVANVPDFVPLENKDRGVSDVVGQSPQRGDDTRQPFFGTDRASNIDHQSPGPLVLGSEPEQQPIRLQDTQNGQSNVQENLIISDSPERIGHNGLETSVITEPKSLQVPTFQQESQTLRERSMQQNPTEQDPRQPIVLHTTADAQESTQGDRALETNFEGQSISVDSRNGQGFGTISGEQITEVRRQIPEEALIPQSQV
ncbi:transmembrane protein [Gracilaria domingensis]|nr:transmembrane protein [Gracilaria domingensis]